MDRARYQQRRAELEAALERDQEELAVALRELEQTAREAVSPAEITAKNFWGLAAGAFAIGFLLGRR